MSTSRNEKKRIGIFCVSLGLALLLILANILAADLLPWSLTKRDVGKDNLSRISEKSLELVRGLEEDVHIYWLCTDGGSDYVLELLLTRYAEAGSRLHIEIPDMTDESVAALIKGYVGETASLSNNSLIIASKRRHTVLDYTDLFLFSNDMLNSYFGAETYLTVTQWAAYMEQNASLLQNSVTSRYFSGEKKLSAAIDYVTAETIPQGYLLLGHGETELPEKLTAYLEAYGMGELDLTAGGEIPSDADCLVLYAPETDLSEEEERVIRAFLEAGGSFLLATDPDCLEFCPRAAGLGSLYGLTAEAGVLSEINETYYEELPTCIKPTLNSANSISSMLSSSGIEVVMPNSHAITVEAGVRSGGIVSPLLTTSGEGESGKKNPAMEATLPVTLPDGTTRTGRFVWFGSADAFTEESAKNYGEGAYALFLSAFMELRQPFSSAYESISPVCMDGESLTGMTRGGAAFWSILCIAILPAACITAGVVIYRKKRV